MQSVVAQLLMAMKRCFSGKFSGIKSQSLAHHFILNHAILTINFKMVITNRPNDGSIIITFSLNSFVHISNYVIDVMLI
jgi:hypothetical protein